MKLCPEYLCFILEATQASALQCLVDLRAEAFDMLRQDPRKALLHAAVLDVGTLEQVLRDEHLEVDEGFLFGTLERWTKSSELRVIGARALAVCLDYGRMAPSFLVGVVSKSGLVTAEALHNAFLKHALYAEQQGVLPTSMRWSPWESSSGRRYFETRDSHGVELMRLQARAPEVLSWTIIVEQSCRQTWAGVAVGDIDTNQWLGMQTGGWVCGSNASVNHATTTYNKKGVKFSDGDTLHFTLDLSGEGTMTLAKNGGKPLTLFDKMCSKATEASFVPPVSLRKPAVMVYVSSYKQSASAPDSQKSKPP
eukprot:Hpha_TRINITY_DN15786_c2_g6::TRINITY_DN15786_c2_g6_i1::g.37419::m.37419